MLGSSSSSGFVVHGARKRKREKVGESNSGGDGGTILPEFVSDVSVI